MSLKDLFRIGKKDPDGDSPANISVSNSSEPKRQLVKEDFYVVGTQYYQDSIKLLACSTSEWKMTGKQALVADMLGKKIYRYTYINKPVKLVPEPDNPEDKNAIAVQIAGEKVGHISRDDNIHVAQILKHRSVKYITSSISGGEYKIVAADGKFTRVDAHIRISVRIAYS